MSIAIVSGNGGKVKRIKVAAVQMESAIGDTQANAEAMAGWLASAADAGSGMIVFPECCLTGYRSCSPAEIAIPGSDPLLLEIEERALGLGLAIGYGFVEGADGTDASPDSSSSPHADSDAETSRPFITYVVTDGTERLVYQKTHLGSIEGAFGAGNELPVSKIAGMRVGVQLCWESHIPDLSTVQRAQGAELILNPYACGLGGAARIEKWDRYLAARAFDNGLFVVAYNALRHTADGGMRGGGIAAYAPDGSRLDCCDSLEDDMRVFDIGGPLPRENPSIDMRGIDYFARRRPELYG